MKKICLIVIVLLFCGCTNKYHKINKDEALKLIENKNAILIDVRSNVEYAEKHIENAVSLPVTTIFDTIEDIYDKEKYIILYCRSGNRSKIAADGLIDLGYKHVYDLGGINNWD